MRSWPIGGFGPLLLLSLSACGGSARDIPYDNPRDPSGGSAGAPSDPSGGTSSGGQGAGGIPILDGVGGNFTDLPCPELPPVEDYLCDPLGPSGQCGVGSKCMPYVVFPSQKVCEAVRYGAFCSDDGVGRQGDECSTNGDYCADGFLCVVGTGGGARCAKMCDVSSGDGCPAGLLCGETDAQNIGVCY